MALLGKSEAQKHIESKQEQPVTAPVPVVQTTPVVPDGVLEAEIAKYNKDAKAEADAKAKADATAAELAEIEFINAGLMVMAPAIAAQAAPVRARSDKQRAMDDRVMQLHNAWKAAGSPSDWAKMTAAKAVGTYFTVPDKTAGIKQLIDRAATFHGLRVKYGTAFTVTEEIRATWRRVHQIELPEAYVGREVISFAVITKRPRGTSNGRAAADLVNQNIATPIVIK